MLFRVKIESSSCLCVCVFVCLCVCVFVCSCLMSLYNRVFVCPFVCLNVRFSVCPSCVCMPVSL